MYVYSREIVFPQDLFVSGSGLVMASLHSDITDVSSEPTYRHRFMSVFPTKLSTSLQLMLTEFKSTRRMAPRCCLYNDHITIALFQSRPLAVVSILPPPACARS